MSAPTPTATSQVFGTAELFESIAQHLSILDLHLMGTTSRAFEATVDSSPVLQRRLFMRAKSDSNNNNFEPEWNPIVFTDTAASASAFSKEGQR